MEEQDDHPGATRVDGKGPFRDDHAIEPGMEIGGYVIDGELGRGGMGVVYSATHPVIGKRVAIKVLKPSLSNNPATVERFMQEARSVNQIGHPNIVDIFDFDKLPDGRSYLVMDLLEGEPLRRRVKRGPLHVLEAANVIDEIASALIAAHDKGFVHRDLKPDNVFLVANPGRFDVKLLDFGLAKLLPGGVGEARAYRTATGAQLGTPDYMSPEQLRGTGVDHRTDIYALGVLAFEILVGKRPRRYSDGRYELDGRQPGEVVSAVPFVPTALAQLVEAMLAAAPDQRPSLAAVRTVIKRLRPSLPSMSVVGLQLPNGGVRAIGTEPALESMSPSKVGARPVLPTPPTGSPTAPGDPPSIPPSPGNSHYAGFALASQPPVDLAPPTQPPSEIAPRIPSRAPSDPSLDSAANAARRSLMAGGVARRASSPPSYAQTVQGHVPALRPAGSPTPATRIGVPPPPAPVSRRHPVQAARPRESRTWLLVGAILAIVAGIILAVVIAS